MAQLTPCRYLLNGLAIIETNSDMRGGRAMVSIGQSPKGRAILSLRSQDGAFHLKLDADAIATIKLEESEDSGTHCIRLLDAQGRRHLSVVMLGDDAAARFQIMLGRWTSCVELRRNFRPTSSPVQRECRSDRKTSKLASKPAVAPDSSQCS